MFPQDLHLTDPLRESPVMRRITFLDLFHECSRGGPASGAQQKSCWAILGCTRISRKNSAGRLTYRSLGGAMPIAIECTRMSTGDVTHSYVHELKKRLRVYCSSQAST